MQAWLRASEGDKNRRDSEITTTTTTTTTTNHDSNNHNTYKGLRKGQMGSALLGSGAGVGGRKQGRDSERDKFKWVIDCYSMLLS